MEQSILKGEPRPGRGTADARRARRAGKATAELYGHGEPNESFLVEQTVLKKLVDEGHYLLNLDIGGKAQVGIMKELQFDTYGDRITHVDFARVSLDEVIETNIEVRVIGNAKGVASGGTLDILHHEIPIRGKARLLPEFIEVEVDHLAEGDAIRSKEISLPEGVELMLDDEDAIVVVHQKVDVEELTATEGAEDAATEPEIVGESLEEGDEESPSGD